jgi:hypothetical protein
MSQMRQELELARELISEKQYDKARTLLRKVKDDPTAQKWLERLDEIDPAAAALAAQASGNEPASTPWQYAGLEVKRSYGIQYKVNGTSHPEWKDQPIYFVLNELGREGWELAAFESINEFTMYILKKPGVGSVQKADVWDQ